MSKIITFSTAYQANHPRKGEPTYFVEQILNQLKCNYQYLTLNYWTKLVQLNHEKIKAGKLTEKQITDFVLSLNFELDTSVEKLHTIRNGHRFAAGEKFTPVIWSGKPYNAPQIIFYDDIEIVKTYEFSNERVHDKYYYHLISHEGRNKELDLGDDLFSLIAKNDGLATPDFTAWFEASKKDFEGQIICWNDPKYLEA